MLTMYIICCIHPQKEHKIFNINILINGEPMQVTLLDYAITPVVIVVVDSISNTCACT